MIDNREYVLQQEQTQASLAKAEAQLVVLGSTINTLENEASSSQAQIAANKAKVWKQGLDYDRYLKLYNEESATKQQVEKVQAQLDVDKSEYRSSQRKLRCISFKNRRYSRRKKCCKG